MRIFILINLICTVITFVALLVVLVRFMVGAMLAGEGAAILLGNCHAVFLIGSFRLVFNASVLFLIFTVLTSGVFSALLLCLMRIINVSPAGQP
jgi:hypothetical protein